MAWNMEPETRKRSAGGYYWNPNGPNSMGSNHMGSDHMGSNPMGSMGFNSGFNGMNSASSTIQPPGNEPLLKMLIPCNVVGHLLGKGGEYINQLRKSFKKGTKIFIAFSGNNEFFPGTSERICLITGSVPRLTVVSQKIIERVNEKYQSVSVFDLHTRIVISPRDVGVLIGKGGATINQIQGKTGAVVSVEKNADENFERVVTITGTTQQRIEAIKEIIALIAETPTNMANTRLNYDGIENMAMGMPNYDSTENMAMGMPNYDSTENMAMGMLPNHGTSQEFPFDKEKLKQTLMSGSFNKEQLKEQLVSAITSNMEGPSGPTFNKEQLKGQLMSAFSSISMGGPSGPSFNKQHLKEQFMSTFTGNSMGGPPNNKKQRLNHLITRATLTIDVPYQMVGWILGRGGSGVQEMSRLTNGAKFEFVEFKTKNERNKGKNDITKATRELTITGDLEQVNAGHELVHARVDEYRMQNQGFF